MHQHVRETAPQPTGQELLQTDTTKTRKIFILLASLIIIVGGSFISYAGVIHPIQIHAQATSVITDIQTAQAQSSPQYLYDQITSRSPTLNDPLDSQHGTWQIDKTCNFSGGAYHVSSTQQSAQTTFILPTCSTEGRKYHDFVYQIQMTFIDGSIGGIVFRAVGLQDYYAFMITDNGMYTTIFSNPTTSSGFAFGRSTAIKTGPNQPNLLTVLARGSSFNLYVNKQFVTSFNDDRYNLGAIGCIILPDISHNFDVAFSNAQVWSL